MKLYHRFIPDFDIKLKTKEKSTFKSHRDYPSVAYEINPMGFINVGCFPAKQGDFIKGQIPERFEGTATCPYQYCGCLDKYAFLRGSGRAKKLNLLEEYVDECKSLA